jgi:hypothetical protein
VSKINFYADFYGFFCIVDRATREQWIAEQIRVAQQKKIDDAAREAAKRKAAIDNMHF